MAKIKLDRKLFNYGEKNGWLAPFDKISSYAETIRILNTDGNGTEGDVLTKGIRDLINAVIIMAAVNENYENLKPEHLAIGTSSDYAGSESIYVEYAAKGNTDETVAIFYNPLSGEAKGVIYKESTNTFFPYNTETKIGKGLGYEQNAIPLWIALLTKMKTVSEWESLLFPLEEYISSTFDGSALLTPDEGFITYALPLCFYAGTNLQNDNKIKPYPIVLKHDKDILPKIPKLALDKKTLGPSKGKIITGDFKVFPVMDGTANGLAGVEPIDFNTFHLDFVKTEFTNEEQLMIPETPADTVIPKEAVLLLNEMKDTWDNGPVTKISQVLCEGASGSGKSFLSRLIAATLKRPYISFACSPNTDEADIKGMLLPIANEDDESVAELDETEKEILKVVENAKEDELVSAVADKIGLPTALMISFDPEGSAEIVYGTSENVPSEQQIFADVTVKVMGKVKSIVAKMKKPSGGVRYKYIPSPIVLAIKNGYFLELQEPSCMMQQGMLSCLFDVLDKDSVGVLNTPMGPIYKHPDFMIMATTNRKYHGTKPLNEAARSRFQYFIKMESPNEDVITQRLIAKTGIDASLARDCARLFKVVEETALEINASGAATLRNLYNFADAMKRGKNEKFCIEHYLLWPITTDEEELADLWDAVETSNILRF